MYEILPLRATDRNNTDQYKEYRLTVKNRLNGAFQVGTNRQTDRQTDRLNGAFQVGTNKQTDRLNSAFQVGTNRQTDSMVHSR